jgi:hypothetical protein
MTKRKKKTDPNQISFFKDLEGTEEITIPEKPKAKMNPNKIKIALSEAVKNTHLTRIEICSMISDLAGREISVAMLNAYTSQARTTHNIPCDLLAPLTVVLGDSILKCISEEAGCTLATRPQMQMAKIGLMIITRDQMEQKINEEIQNLPLMRGIA